MLHRLSRSSTVQFPQVKYRSFLIAALFLGGTVLSERPAVAASPSPGTVIENQATGSFIDTADNQTKTVTSDIVKVTVAEVAGITVTTSGYSGSPTTGGTVYFDFTVTNIGNDPTQFFIPGSLSAASGGIPTTVEVTSYDADGSGPSAPISLTGVLIPTAGAATGSLPNANTFNNGSIPAGGTITVRVGMIVTANSGQTISATLGDTAAPPNNQNQDYSTTTAGLKDLYTQDNSGTANGDTTGDPINGDATNHRKEASMTATVTVDAPTAQTPLVCDGRFYQVRSISNNSGLYLINRFTNPFTNTLLATTNTGIVLNGLAYNPVDNFMYALLRGTSNTDISGVQSGKMLYRLDGSSVVNVGNITGLPIGFTPTAADFGPDGSYYVTRAGGSTELYKINVATQTATLITMSQNTGNIGDMAYNPKDNYLYGIGGVSNNTLFKIDPVSGNVTTTPLSLTDTWGTAFFNPIGTFYGYANSGNFYRIDIVTGAATLLSTAPTASASDGADCQYTSQKIDVVKAVGTVTKANATTFDVSYTIQVKNTGAFNAPNVQVTENLNRTFSTGNPTISIQTAPVATGGLAINPAFDGVTASNGYNLLSGVNSLAAGASATITLTVRVVYPNIAAVPSTAQNNQVYASTITSTTAPGTPNPGYTFQSNIPVPPPDLLTADVSTNGTTPPTTANGDSPSPTPVTFTVSNPNVLLVKRITAINGGTATVGGDDLALYNQDDAYPYDDNVLEPSLAPSTAFPTADTIYWPNTIGRTSSTFLIGGRTGGQTKPQDEIEYTIYFLSTGTSPAQNVTICDRVPDHQTFVPTGYNALSAAPNGDPTSERGIAVSYSGSLFSYTNNDDNDTAKFYPAGSSLPPVCGTGTNTSGAILVNLGAGATGTNTTTSGGTGGTLPNTTASGSPPTSYGFVRFKAKVN